MTAQPTPGPWLLSERSGFFEILAASPDCDWFGHTGMHAVAYADTEIDEPEQAANARLIAAAPTMRAYIESRALGGCVEASGILEAIDACR